MVFSPPHRPLSVVITIRPTFFTVSRLTMNGCLYSGLALERCPAICQIRDTYGRVWRIRSCAFFIFDAATISMALVILRVLCTLLILLRISLVPAMPLPQVCRSTRGSGRGSGILRQHQYAPDFLNSSIAAASAFSSSAVRSWVVSMRSMIALCFWCRNALSAPSKASAFFTSTSSR